MIIKKKQRRKSWKWATTAAFLIALYGLALFVNTQQFHAALSETIPIMTDNVNENKNLPSTLRIPSSSTPSNQCISQVQKFLTAREKSESLDVLLCSSPTSASTTASLSFPSENASLASSLPPLAILVVNDRSKIRTLERRDYLSKLRSYRLSGMVCNDDMDPELPHISTEPAFKCLPREFKRRACMDGSVHMPKACSKFGVAADQSHSPYIPEPDRREEKKGTFALDESIRKKCELSAEIGLSKCHEIALGIAGSGAEPGQFAKGVPEAKVLTQNSSSHRPIWRREVLDLHLSMIREGKDVSPLDYPGAHVAIQNAINVVNVKDKSVAIFGSISPWVESIVHQNGARSPTMTVDYNQPISYDERMDTELMTTMLENDIQYDVAVSYSSIEHDGLSRYGDPLDPDGDFAAMKEIWLKVAPGGYLILNVPLHFDDLFYWYSMRFYGPSRLPVLIRGWEYAGLVTCKRIYGPKEDFLLSEVHTDSPVILLRKPQSVHADDNLNPSRFGDLICDVATKKCSLKSNEK